MIISVLINSLEKVQEEHGDIEVVCSDSEWEYRDIDEIRVVTEDMGERVIYKGKRVYL